MTWAYLVHRDLGSEQIVVDDPAVIEVQESRGWERRDLPDGVDPDESPQVLLGAIAEAAEAAQVKAEEEAAELRGKALDDALEDAGLPKTGSADEKRARLAEHQAASAPNNEEEEVTNG